MRYPLPLFLWACTGAPSEPDTQGSLADSDSTTDSPSSVVTDECVSASPDCTCIMEPVEADLACWHGNGGRFSEGACTASSQCCAGEWGALETCGACTCTQSTGSEGCVPEEDGEEICFPRFHARALPLSDALRSSMTGVSWHEGCPVNLDDLTELEMSHWGFDGEIHQGSLIVASEVAETVSSALEHAYDWRFAIERMEPVYLFKGSDDASMAANNTSAFNCRAVTGGSRWSQHSYGNAIDINPVQNPYVAGSTILPPEGAEYIDRDPAVPGLIVDPGPLTGAFLRKSWGWGGNWSSLKDYQHLSETGD